MESSSRCRAVAQYLKDHSPSQSQDDEPGVISMNDILEGKTRKQCARMFFESLVTKCFLNFFSLASLKSIACKGLALLSLLSIHIL